MMDDKYVGRRTVLLAMLDMLWRVVLTYVIVISIDLVASAYFRAYPVNVPEWIIGKEAVSKMRTLQGLELLKYSIQDSTRDLIPAYCALFLYGAFGHWRDEVRGSGFKVN